MPFIGPAKSHGMSWLFRISSKASLAAGHPSLFDQWNCSSSVEPVSALTLDEPPWITVVTSSK